MSNVRPYGIRNASATDVRPMHRGSMRNLQPGMTSTLPRPLRSLGVQKQKGSTQKFLPGCVTFSHALQEQLDTLAVSAASNTISMLSGDSNDMSNGVGKDPGQMTLASRREMQKALSVVITRQNVEWTARYKSLLERRDSESLRSCYQEGQNGLENKNKPVEPLCMLLHSLLAESRQEWRKMLASRVRALEREVRQSKRAPSTGCGSNSSDDTEDEWSVGQLYHTLVKGLNSVTTEELLTSRLFGGDASLCYDSIDSFGLLTVFRAPIQELLSRCDVLVPSLTTLRRYFSALHPSNGSPKVALHTEPSAHEAEEELDIFLRHGDNPEALANALRGGVSPSLRRLLYARALQLPLVVTDGISLFGGHGELQGNQHSDGVAGCLSFATKHSRDRIRRRMHHSHTTREHEVIVKVVQAIIKVDNSQFVGNSDKYFIFLEETELLAFSLLADKSIPDMHLKNTLRLMGRPSEQIDSYLVFFDTHMDKSGTHPRTATPSGLFPVSSCSMLIAPICYITGDTVEQYELASALFGQLWCRLQGPTPELAQCCWMFEALVTRFAAPACLHASRTLGFPPLRLAIHWMISGFVEILEPAELLSFWDLILSYHVEEMFSDRTLFSVPVQKDIEGKNDLLCAPCALWLLPLMAASLFVYRAPLLERCSTAEEMLLLFKEGHHIRCRPLLQYLLFMAK